MKETRNTVPVEYGYRKCAERMHSSQTTSNTMQEQAGIQRQNKGGTAGDVSQQEKGTAKTN